MGGLAQNVQKTPPGKNVQKSQGQIFPRSNGKKPVFPEKNRLNRENRKNVQKTPPGKNVQKSQGQIFQECVEC